MNSAEGSNFGASNKNYTSVDEYVECSFEATDNGTDTPKTAIGGQTTDATRYLHLKAVVGKEWDRTADFPTGDGIYRFVTTDSGTGIAISTDFVRITGLALKMTIQSSSDMLIGLGNTVEDFTVEDCYLYCLDSSYNYCRAIYFGYSTSSKSGTHYVRNNKIEGNTDGTPPDLYCALALECAGKTVYAQNNTIINFGVGIRRSYGTMIPENNVIWGCDDSWNGTMSSARNNAYEEGSDPGTGGVSLSGATHTDVFVSTTDYNVADSDSVLYDAGVDLSGTFTNDINGVTRGTWDIGAYELPVEAGETVESVELLIPRPAFGISTQDVYEAVVELPEIPRPDFNVVHQDLHTATVELTPPLPAPEVHTQDIYDAVVSLVLARPGFETHSQDLESLIAGLALLTPSYEVSTLDQEGVVAELLLPRPAFGVVAEVEEYAAADLTLKTPLFGVEASVTEYGAVVLSLPTPEFGVQATVGETLTVAFVLDRPGFGVQASTGFVCTVGFDLPRTDYAAQGHENPQGTVQFTLAEPTFSVYGDVQIMGSVGVALPTPAPAVVAPRVVDTNVAHALETPQFAIQATYVGDLEGYHVVRRYYEKPSRVMRKRIR